MQQAQASLVQLALNHIADAESVNTVTNTQCVGAHLTVLRAAIVNGKSCMFGVCLVLCNVYIYARGASLGATLT